MEKRYLLRDSDYIWLSRVVTRIRISNLEDGAIVNTGVENCFIKITMACLELEKKLRLDTLAPT